MSENRKNIAIQQDQLKGSVDTGNKTLNSRRSGIKLYESWDLPLK